MCVCVCTCVLTIDVGMGILFPRIGTEGSNKIPDTPTLNRSQFLLALCQVVIGGKGTQYSELKVSTITPFSFHNSDKQRAQLA